MDLDFGHLPRTQGNIGEDFGGSGTSQPDGTLILCTGLLTGEVHVVIFENLVETVLEGTLEGVANQGGPETLPSTSDTLLGDDGSETGDDTLVLGGVHLESETGKSKNAFLTGEHHAPACCTW